MSEEKKCAEDHLKEDLLEIRYRPALLVTAVFSAVFIFAALGSMLGGRAAHVLVIVASLPLSLFSLPLLDQIESPLLSAAVLYGMNFVFGAVFWFLAVLVTTNLRLFLAHKKLDYLLIAVVAVLVLSALLFKHLRGYGFFLGLEGEVVWKEGLPHKRVYCTSTNSTGKVLVGGMGWIANYRDGKWVHYKVPGKSRKLADSLVSIPDGRIYAKFGGDVYEITRNRWTRIPLKRSSGRLALSKSGAVSLFSVEGVTELHGLVFESVDAYGDCVPGTRQVFTDSRGWQWTGGKLGHLACVFDGKRLVSINNRDLAGDEPAGDSATAFAEDRDGVIWFGTEKGFIFKVSDSSARKLNLKYPQEPGMVTSMLFDSTGELFLTYERPPYHKGPFRAPEEGGAIEALEVPRAETFKHICCLARDDDNRIWFGTNRGLQLFRDASPRPR